MTAQIFVSRPSVLSPRQCRIGDAWLGILRRRGAEFVTVERHEYLPDPWRLLRSRLGTVDGVLLLGFRQLEIHAGVWRPRSEEQALPPEACTSTWVQIEAGMAFMAGLPVLALREPGVADGAFDDRAWTHNVVGDALCDPGPGVPASVDRWFAMLHGRCRPNRLSSIEVEPRPRHRRDVSPYKLAK